MTPTTYAFQHVDALLLEKIAGGVGVKPLSVTVAQDGTVLVTMPDTLSVIEQQMLADFMSTRSLFPQTKGAFPVVSALLVPLESILVNSADYDLIGGAVTNPSAFVPDVSRAFGRLNGAFRVKGDGAKLRITEDKGGVLRVMGEFDLPDTGNVWVPSKFFTDAPSQSVDDMIYTLEGTLGAATFAAVRFVSLSLLEKL